MVRDDNDDHDHALRSGASSASQSTVKRAQAPPSPTQRLSTPRQVRPKVSDESSTTAGNTKVSGSPCAHPIGPSDHEPGPSTGPQNAPPRPRPETMRRTSKMSSHVSSLAMTRSSYDSSILSSLIDGSDPETDTAGDSTLRTNYSTFSNTGSGPSRTNESGVSDESKRKARRKKLRKKLAGSPEGPCQGIPFPTQDDPAKPLRPKRYRQKRTQHHITRWFLRSEGYLLVVLAQAFYVGMHTLGRTFSELDPTYCVPYQWGISWACAVLFLLLRRDANPLVGPRDVRPLLVLRAFAGVAGTYALSYALDYLSTTDVVAMVFLTPLATALLGTIVLDEPLLGREVMTICLSLCGIVLIARPRALFGPEQENQLDWFPSVQHYYHPTRPFHPTLSQRPLPISTPKMEQRAQATAVALAGILCLGATFVLIRKVRDQASAAHSVAYIAFWSTIIPLGQSLYTSWPTIARIQLPRTQEGWIWLVLLGLALFTAQLLTAWGLQRQRTKATNGASALYLQLVFLVGASGSPPSALTALGCALIVVSAVYGTFIK